MGRGSGLFLARPSACGRALFWLMHSLTASRHTAAEAGEARGAEAAGRGRERQRKGQGAGGRGQGAGGTGARGHGGTGAGGRGHGAWNRGRGQRQQGQEHGTEAGGRGSRDSRFSPAYAAALYPRTFPSAARVRVGATLRC